MTGVAARPDLVTNLTRLMDQYRTEQAGMVCRHPAADISDCANDADWLMRHGIEAALLAEIERRGDDLGAAWAAAEAALPEGWHVCGVEHIDDDEHEAVLWRAESYDYEHQGQTDEGFGSSPAAALRNLAERLRMLPVMDAALTEGSR